MHPVLGVLQFVTAIIALIVPVSAGIYLAITMSWTLVQRVVLTRAFPMMGLPATKE